MSQGWLLCITLYMLGVFESAYGLLLLLVLFFNLLCNADSSISTVIVLSLLMYTVFYR